jgi:hypothetical protein
VLRLIGAVPPGDQLGGYGRDLNAKRALLLAEGVPVSRSTIKEFAKRRFNGR